MHFDSKPIDESRVGPKRRSDKPCSKCGALTVDVECIDSDHEDYRITCATCGRRYIVEGPDA